MQLLILISAFLAVQAKTLYHQLDGYTFEQYLAEFNLKFPESEMAQRRAIFNSEIKRIQSHNSQKLSWKEGVSKFTVLTPEEKKAFHGRNKSSNKKFLTAAKPLPADFKMRAVSELPTHVDWRESGIISSVKDQGYCGSCWAFASTSVIESHVAKETGLLFDLSVQQMAMCAPNPNHCGGTGGCAGSTSELAFDYVANSAGLFSEYQYAYASYYGKNYQCTLPSGVAPVATIDGYVQLPENNYSALMNAIATVGPVAVSVDASAWSAYESGVFDGCNQKNPDIDHAVVLVGYGTDSALGDYWLIRNSWSPAWGEKGFIRIKRTANEEGRCGSDITPQDGSACEGDNEPKNVCGTCGVLYDSAYPTGARRA